jgi:lipopolysaccharide transport system ATP-binding protein
MQRTGYRTFRESLTDLVSWPLRQFGNGAAGGPTEEFWALQDVNCEIEAGEVVGLVGQNGAGKSTLLKILSRITKPTAGEVKIRGRIGSLLEVGTGFHPELTGRENIFLNGAILGMARRETVRKFSEIVSFAGIENFLDTPVKRYSSGMYVRLAFSVAAHLEPDILLVDEVLAVGDHTFQKKCLGKMGELAGSGRTVFLVSHNLPLLSNLCTRAILLDRGRVEQDGVCADVIRSYCAQATGSLSVGGRVSLQDHPGRARGRPPLLRGISLHDEAGNYVTSVPLGGDLFIEVEVGDLAGRPESCILLDLCDTFGTVLARANSQVQSNLSFTHLPTVTVLCHIEDVRLQPGDYMINVHLGDGMDSSDRVDRAIGFSVDPADIYKTGRNVRHGLFALNAQWEMKPAPARNGAGGAVFLVKHPEGEN